MHSHDFRDAAEFKNRNVLVVGASYSAEDIALQTRKYGAKHVIATYRNAPMGFKWPKGIEERPLVQRFDETTAYFKDGSKAEVTAHANLALSIAIELYFHIDRRCHSLHWISSSLSVPFRGHPSCRSQCALPRSFVQGNRLDEGRQQQGHVCRHTRPILHLDNVRRSG